MPTEDTTSMGNATERNVDKSPKAMMASSVVTYLNLAFGNVLGQVADNNLALTGHA